jgi:hypothetical protein
MNHAEIFLNHQKQMNNEVLQVLRLPSHPVIFIMLSRLAATTNDHRIFRICTNAFASLPIAH